MFSVLVVLINASQLLQTKVENLVASLTLLVMDYKTSVPQVVVEEWEPGLVTGMVNTTKIDTQQLVAMKVVVATANRVLGIASITLALLGSKSATCQMLGTMDM